jgi:16S rRNA G966 N2-methylase RsmD
MVRSAIKAVNALSHGGEEFDLVWADPPFEDWSLGLHALMAAATEAIVVPNGVCCLECPDRAEIPEDMGLLRLERTLDGGASRLLIMRVSEDRQESLKNPVSLRA